VPLPASHQAPTLFDFSWDIWAVMIGLILVIVLFLGPGMWSSSTEPIWTTLARAFRDKAPAQESAPEAPDKAPPSEPPASHS